MANLTKRYDELLKEKEAKSRDEKEKKIELREKQKEEIINNIKISSKKRLKKILGTEKIGTEKSYIFTYEKAEIPSTILGEEYEIEEECKFDYNKYIHYFAFFPKNKDSEVIFVSVVSDTKNVSFNSSDNKVIVNRSTLYDIKEVNIYIDFDDINVDFELRKPIKTIKLAPVEIEEIYEYVKIFKDEEVEIYIPDFRNPHIYGDDFKSLKSMIDKTKETDLNIENILEYYINQKIIENFDEYIASGNKGDKEITLNILEKRVILKMKMYTKKYAYEAKVREKYLPIASLLIGEISSYPVDIKQAEIDIIIDEDSSNYVEERKYFAYDKKYITFGELMGVK